MSGFIKLSDVIEESNGTLFFECPGCKMLHGVNINRPNSPKWSWDGNKSKPTFSPSVLVTGKYGAEQKELRCHSFVKNGEIQFLNDCSHELAGKTVPMVKLED